MRELDMGYFYLAQISQALVKFYNLATCSHVSSKISKRHLFSKPSQISESNISKTRTAVLTQATFSWNARKFAHMECLV